MVLRLRETAYGQRCGITSAALASGGSTRARTVRKGPSQLGIAPALAGVNHFSSDRHESWRSENEQAPHGGFQRWNARHHCYHHGAGIETAASDSHVGMPDWAYRNLSSVVWYREVARLKRSARAHSGATRWSTSSRPTRTSSIRMVVHESSKSEPRNGCRSASSFGSETRQVRHSGDCTG